MNKTRLFELIDKSVKKIKRKLITYWFQLPLAILLFLLGFLISSALGTLFAQTQQWQVIDGVFLVVAFEVLHKYIYNEHQKFELFGKRINFYKNANYLKIGIIFGFFVDAFKLGS